MTESVKEIGWAARDSTGVLSPLNFTRRPTDELDVQFKVLYCGICHSDLHSIKNEWGNAIYPLIPGHEVIGVVTEVGSKVEKYKVGDKVGVGCLVDSCRNCDQCADWDSFAYEEQLRLKATNEEKQLAARLERKSAEKGRGFIPRKKVEQMERKSRVKSTFLSHKYFPSRALARADFSGAVGLFLIVQRVKWLF